MDEITIGNNMRRLREASGKTLTAVAKRALLSKGALSKIENGQISTPISTLLRIATVLGIPIGDFFTEKQQNPSFVFTPKGQGARITQDGSEFGYAYDALALEKRGKLAEPFLLTIQPGDPMGEFRHGGEEFIYMLEGQLRFRVGEQVLTLTPGDSLYFNSEEIHTTEVLGEIAARFLCVFMPNPTKD